MIPPKKRRIDSKNSRIGEVLKEHGHVFSLHPYKFLVSWNGEFVKRWPRVASSRSLALD